MMKCLYNDKGFTLVEIIIVIGVISILAGGMAPMISQRLEAAREDATRAEMENLQKALLAYAKDTGGFPAQKKKSEDSLVALEIKTGTSPDGWRGPYMIEKYERRDYARDAWNTPYHYGMRKTSKPDDERATLTSPGPDRRIGSADDIVLSIQLPQEDISQLIDRTRARLKLIEGDIYGRASDVAPGTYQAPDAWKKDGWGNTIRYKRYNPYSAAVYSVGPNGIDDDLSKDDLYRALLWTPESGKIATDTGGKGKKKHGKKKKSSGKPKKHPKKK